LSEDRVNHIDSEQCWEWAKCIRFRLEKVVE
jgi:hypothetical protein